MSSYEFLDPTMVRNLIASAFFGAAVMGARGFSTARIVKGAKVLSKAQRARLFYARSVCGTLLVLGLGAIWMTQIQALLFSLTAVLVALVIATKELIQCASGSLLRTAGGLFRIGDWVEVEGVRGEIIEHNLMTTTMREMEHGAFGYGFTGRMLVLPNSHLFTGSSKVQRFGRKFVLHRFSVTFEADRSLAEIVGWWEAETRRALKPFEAFAARYHRAVERRMQGSLVGPEPLVAVTTNEIAKRKVEVMLFCPTDEAMALERGLKVAFLDWLDGYAASTAAVAPVRILDLAA